MTKITPSGAAYGDVGAEIDVALALLEDHPLADQTKRRIANVLRSFGSYARHGMGVMRLAEVDESVANGFIGAVSRTGEPPGVATMHLRRSAIRLLFRLARDLSFAVGDPTLDIELPPRSSLVVRPLTDDEILLCRSLALDSRSETRWPAAWALAEATATTSELGCIRVSDLDLDSKLVSISGGSKTAPRYGQLTEWGSQQLARRVRTLRARGPEALIYAGKGSVENRHAAGCMAISETLRRAGLASEPDVRPASVRAWAGLQVFRTSRCIDEVARRLGMRSLDRAADTIGWDWKEDPS